MNWEFPRAGKQYATFARVPLCRACGYPYVPPGVGGGCCSVRCTHYLETASHPVLGDPLFGPHQSMLCRGGCGLRFDSRGIVLCPECWDRSRSKAGSEISAPDRVTGADGKSEAFTPARHDEPIRSDRDPRSRCFW
jgi:hypothetical protein